MRAAFGLFYFNPFLLLDIAEIGANEGVEKADDVVGAEEADDVESALSKEFDMAIAPPALDAPKKAAIINLISVSTPTKI